MGDGADVGFEHVAGGEGGGAEADSTGDLGGDVTGDGVLCSRRCQHKHTLQSKERRKRKEKARRTVDSNAQHIADLLHLTARQPKRPQIPKHQMVIRPARLQLISLLDELVRQRPCVGHDLFRVGFPGRVGSLLESGGDTGDGIVVRATLAGGEDGVVHALFEVGACGAVFAEEDETGTGTTEGFMPIHGLIFAS